MDLIKFLLVFFIPHQNTFGILIILSYLVTGRIVDWDLLITFLCWSSWRQAEFYSSNTSCSLQSLNREKQTIWYQNEILSWLLLKSKINCKKCCDISVSEWQSGTCLAGLPLSSTGVSLHGHSSQSVSVWVFSCSVTLSHCHTLTLSHLLLT